MRTPSAFDLAQAADVTAVEDEGQDVHLKGFDGTPAYVGEGEDRVPVLIRVVGSYSQRHRDLVHRQRQDMMRRRKFTPSWDEAARQQIELAAGCVLSWQGITERGEPLPSTPENAIRLFETAPWVYDQVQDAIGDHARFFGNGSTS